jgi:Concanavalin A-like lectin/glucanases superfamily
MSTRSNSPYVPSFIGSLLRDAKPIQATYSDLDLTDSNHGNTGSFKYDPLGYPLKSTQQLNVDWSGFENHCFFSSAEVKVNEAFNKIINGYPFDGTKKEVEEFLDSLTGFEKYVFDSFPRWSGTLHFSGTQVNEDPLHGADPFTGTWVSVKDKSGNLFPDISKNSTGETILNPGDDTSLTIETLLYLPETTNDVQVLFQKQSSETSGFTVHIDQSPSADTAPVVFSVSSGSYKNSVTQTLTKGQYNHVCFTLNKETREDSLQIYVNEALKAESKNAIRFNKLDIDEADFLIGSGSSFYSSTTLVTPVQTFSGTLDELRVFHSVRDTSTQKIQMVRGIYATPELKLYYRFNEPSGSLSLNANKTVDGILLDSSGNSLHSVINNFNFNLRLDATADPNNVLVHEKKEFQTVLFPAYKSVLDLNTSLLLQAKEYDRANPNNIIKLVPQHYLLEGASQDGFEEIEGNGGEPYGGSGIPGQGLKGSVQIILSFLYIWAKFFDELKMYIDSFVTLKTVSYDTTDTIPDNFLEDMVRYYGFNLPKFFNHSTVEQFAEGQNVDGLTDIEVPLKKIQAILTRRVLINLPDIIKSKGTQHSIKSFLRSVGIDPENSLRIREYGGPTIKQISKSREKRTEPGAMVTFVSSSLVTSTPLSASRIEPGYPEPAGTFVVDPITKFNVGTTSASDGLLTSGSWNVETVFKMPPQNMGQIIDPNGNQSLFRIVTTGSFAGDEQGLIANIVATQFIDHPIKPATLTAYLRPGTSTASPLLTLSLTLSGTGIFDGEKWNVAVGCQRNDSIGSEGPSLYYLRAGRNESGDLIESYATSSYFYEKSGVESNVFRDVSSTYNASGSIIAIGSNQAFVGSPAYPFLNDTLNVDDVARTTDFAGWASGLRFWSKGMSIEEWKEHARNFKSVGVDDPLVNYNYVSRVSGSFEKLRLDTLQKQPVRDSDNSGNLTFLDFSMNCSGAFGSGFLTGSRVILGDLFSYSYLSSRFDEAATDDKIRIRSFNDNHLLEENPWAVPAPSFLSNAMFLAEEPQDDLRLSIEFSMVDSLDKDIATMFSSFDALNDYIGSPENMFSPDYPDLEHLRDVYFNRLTGKPDFRKFLEFYRWFDTSISTFVEQLVPNKTLFKGTNFVVESHMLERHKNMYRHSGNYLGEKQVIDDSLLLQQIVGKLKKY